MGKVLTERPRSGSIHRYSRVRPSAKFCGLDEDGEDEICPRPGHQGMRRAHTSRKWFSDLLGPLQRFLHARCGRPWDLVRSEICASFPEGGGTLQRHLWEHIGYMVTEGCVREGDSILDPQGHEVINLKGDSWGHTAMYVLADGILRRNTPRKIPKKSGSSEIPVVWVDFSTMQRATAPYIQRRRDPLTRKMSLFFMPEVPPEAAVQWKGVWYRVTFVRGDILGLDGFPIKSRMFYPPPSKGYPWTDLNLNPSTKVQMSSKQIRRLGLK